MQERSATTKHCGIFGCPWYLTCRLHYNIFLRNCQYFGKSSIFTAYPCKNPPPAKRQGVKYNFEFYFSTNTVQLRRPKRQASR